MVHQQQSSRGMRLAQGVGVAFGISVLACAKTPPTSPTTTVTSGTYDIEAGPCMCRLPQDEFLTCCRSAMELTCRCTGGGNWGCQMVPTGRTCGNMQSPR